MEYAIEYTQEYVNQIKPLKDVLIGTIREMVYERDLQKEEFIMGAIDSLLKSGVIWLEEDSVNSTLRLRIAGDLEHKKLLEENNLLRDKLNKVRELLN